MENNGNGSKFVSFRVVVGSLAALVLLLAGGVIADTRATISRIQYATECLQREKVDKEQHYRELGEIKSILTRMEDKIDKIKAMVPVR